MRRITTTLAVSGICGLAAGQCVIEESSRLGGSGAEASGLFGSALAADAGLALIGAPHEAVTGAAYVFSRSGSVWTEFQRLAPTDSSAADFFGDAVGISGDRALVGAPLHDSPTAFAGAVYAFERSGGVWVQTEKLAPLDLSTGEGFGGSIALDSSRALISSADEVSGDILGAVYVYRHTNAGWTELQKLHASDAADQQRFGSAIDLDGSVAAIAAEADDEFGTFAGAVYVFRLGPGGWTEEQKLTASDASADSWFGTSVAIEGDSLLVGALTDSPISNAGSVYVFTFDGTTWTEQQKLAPIDPDQEASFGCSLDLKDGLAAIGRRDNGIGTPGSAQFFRDSEAGWVEVCKYVTSDGMPNDNLGAEVALDGDTAIVAANLAAGLAGAGEGAVYTFSLPDLGLRVSSTLVAGNDPLDLYTCGGQPGALTMLTVNQIDTIPVFVNLGITTFGTKGFSVRSGTIPAGLDLDATFQAIGFIATGVIRESLQVTVSVQP